METAQALATASPTVLLALMILALITGKLIHPRELTVCNKTADERIAQAEQRILEANARTAQAQKEADEWKQLHLRGLAVAGRAVEHLPSPTRGEQ